MNPHRGQSLNIESGSPVIYYYSVLKLFPESIVNDMILCQKIKGMLLKALPEQFFTLASRTLSVEKNNELRYLTYNYILDEFIYVLINEQPFCETISYKFQYLTVDREALHQITEIFEKVSREVVENISVYQNKNLQLRYDRSCVKPLVLYKSQKVPLIQMMDEMKIEDNMSDSTNITNNESVSRSQSDVRDLSMAMQIGKMKKFTKQQEKMQDSIFEQVLLIDTTDKPWHIASQLVVVVSEASIGDQGLKRSEKVKFIQPATSFYKKVLQLWMLEKSSSCQKMVFSQFICKAKHFFGPKWSDKYMTSMYFVFQQLEAILHQLMQQNQDPSYLIIQIVHLLQERMKALWEQNIIVNARNLIQKQ